ncbi:MAG: inositol monophosphatase [Bacteroidales bacterium]|nr:inositol monophosphatase [Bacteroidales bacterium]
MKRTGQKLLEITFKVAKLARETGLFITGEAAGFDPEMAEKKGLHDFVSYVDVEAEKMIVKGLSEILPGSGFFTEEGTSAGNEGKVSGGKSLLSGGSGTGGATGDSGAPENGSTYTWIVDPLDGTTNFLHGLPPYSISIALSEEGKVVAGVVYIVTSDEMFTATIAGGAWLNGTRISVSDVSRIEDSLIATGFPYKNFSRLNAFMGALDYFIRNTHGVRRMGSAAVDLAYVACGRFDAFFEYNLNPWDVAAGALLVREAGGMTSDFSGDGDNLTGAETIASNSLLYDNFRKIVGTFMVGSGDSGEIR